MDAQTEEQVHTQSMLDELVSRRGAVEMVAALPVEQIADDIRHHFFVMDMLGTPKQEMQLWQQARVIKNMAFKLSN